MLQKSAKHFTGSRIMVLFALVLAVLLPAGRGMAESAPKGVPASAPSSLKFKDYNVVFVSL